MPDKKIEAGKRIVRVSLAKIAQEHRMLAYERAAIGFLAAYLEEHQNYTVALMAAYWLGEQGELHRTRGPIHRALVLGGARKEKTKRRKP